MMSPPPFRLAVDGRERPTGWVIPRSGMALVGRAGGGGGGKGGRAACACESAPCCCNEEAEDGAAADCACPDHAVGTAACCPSLGLWALAGRAVVAPPEIGTADMGRVKAAERAGRTSSARASAGAALNGLSGVSIAALLFSPWFSTRMRPGLKRLRIASRFMRTQTPSHVSPSSLAVKGLAPAVRSVCTMPRWPCQHAMYIAVFPTRFLKSSPLPASTSLLTADMCSPLQASMSAVLPLLSCRSSWAPWSTRKSTIAMCPLEALE